MYTVQEMAGLSMHQIFTVHQGHTFSRTTISLIAIHVVRAADQLKLLYDLHKLGVTHNALCPEKVLTSNNIADPRLYLIGISDARKINKYNKLLDPTHTNERPVKVGKFSALAIHLGACNSG